MILTGRQFRDTLEFVKQQRAGIGGFQCFLFLISKPSKISSLEKWNPEYTGTLLAMGLQKSASPLQWPLGLHHYSFTVYLRSQIFPAQEAPQGVARRPAGAPWG